jgi:hypothetical protein
MATDLEISTGTPVYEGLRLGGAALAHAMWSVDGGDELVPFAMVAVGDERTLHRFVIELSDEAITMLHGQVGTMTVADQYSVLVFGTWHRNGNGGSLFGVVNVHLVDHEGALTGTVMQVYRPGQKSRMRGRSRPSTVVGTPVPSDEIDTEESRMALLLGVMSHPEGQRLFPQLAGFAQEMIEANRTAQ